RPPRSTLFPYTTLFRSGPAEWVKENLTVRPSALRSRQPAHRWKHRSPAAWAFSSGCSYRLLPWRLLVRAQQALALLQAQRVQAGAFACEQADLLRRRNDNRNGPASAGARAVFLSVRWSCVRLPQNPWA